MVNFKTYYELSVLSFLSHLHDGELRHYIIQMFMGFLSHLHDGEQQNAHWRVFVDFLSHLHDGEPTVRTSAGHL